MGELIVDYDEQPRLSRVSRVGGEGLREESSIPSGLAGA
jgi:hypothetical protein